MAVIGACMTPAIRPAIPTSTKFCSGRLSEDPASIRFSGLESTKPAIAPTNRVGPKVPQTPPPALVKVMEKTFRSITSMKNTGIIQGVSRIDDSQDEPS